MPLFTTKHQRLAALRPLSPESVASLAAAWDVRMVASPDHFIDISKMIPKRTTLHGRSLLQVSGSGQNAQATWRGHSARRQTDHFPEVRKMIPNPRP